GSNMQRAGSNAHKLYIQHGRHGEPVEVHMQLPSLESLVTIYDAVKNVHHIQSLSRLVDRRPRWFISTCKRDFDEIRSYTLVERRPGETTKLESQTEQSVHETEKHTRKTLWIETIGKVQLRWMQQSYDGKPHHSAWYNDPECLECG